jgi:hypothetical protein
MRHCTESDKIITANSGNNDNSSSFWNIKHTYFETGTEISSILQTILRKRG